MGNVAHALVLSNEQLLLTASLADCARLRRALLLIRSQLSRAVRRTY